MGISVIPSMGLLEAASLGRDYHYPLASIAPPSFVDSISKLHRTSSSSWKRRRRSLRSTLVCSNTTNFRWSLSSKRSFAVRANAGGEDADRAMLNNGEGHEGSHVVGNADADDGHGQQAGKKSAMVSVKDALVLGTQRYMREFQDELKDEIGLDVDDVKRVVSSFRRRWEELIPLLSTSKMEADKFICRLRDAQVRLKQQVWPQFVSWNRPELWKDVKQWDAQRWGALIVYILVAASCVRALHNIFIKPQQMKLLANSYMEAVIPDPSPQNIRKLRMGVWRKIMPKGLQMRRYVCGPDGELHRDLSYIGENPWEEQEQEEPKIDLIAEIDKNPNLTQQQKDDLKAQASEIADMERKQEEERAKMTWSERLLEWDKQLKLEDLKDRLLADNSKFVIGIDIDELKKSITQRKDVREPSRAFLVSKTWWKYRPKLPYMYFLSKLHRLEVDSVVYTSDTRRLYVTMKDGFPKEYTVDIPVDPFLYDLLKSCEVEMDLLGGSEWSYYARAFLVLAPSVFILLQLKHVSNMLMKMTSEKIIDLLKMDREHLILPEDAAEKAKSEYRDVVIGDKVWKVLEEIMGYMREPMRYYERGLFLPRGMLISGPPGTGKTLLARAIARESGLPFVFASGAEFVESSTADGAEKVFNLFFTARANAPSFIFIDEIDALAGKGVDDDPERKATFDQLISELDGLPENTSVDRFSKRQAVVLICATNRPQELHPKLLRPGRIDREIHIGLPGEQQRIRIFSVHSRNRRLAKDVDFSKLVFRTAGYSGADVRNMINEAGIMAVRRGRTEICQQDFVDVLDKQLFEGLGMSLTDEEQIRAQQRVPLETRHLLAVHEAGHVLLAHLFPRYDRHALTHLLPGGKQHALTLFYPREEMLSQNFTTVGYLKMHLVVAHGGRCAEKLIFGEDITDGGQDDLARISQIAREIAISYASPRLGLYPMLWKDKFDPPLPPGEVDLIPKNWDRPGNRIANMTMELSEMFTREVTRYADEAEDEAMQALSANRHILDKLALILLERININGLEVADIIKGMDPVMLPDYLEMSTDYVEGEDIRERMRFEELDIWQAPLPSS